MCRALRVLCAAPDRPGLVALKRRAASVHWELVGGATTIAELASQVADLRPDVVVVDGRLGPAAVRRARAARPTVRVIGVGGLEGVDAVAASPDDVRDVILGSPSVGGPVSG